MPSEPRTRRNYYLASLLLALDIAFMRTLLVVDDYDGVLDTLKWVLESRGYRALTAKTGEAALALARTELVNAALIDAQMPVMDGFELCRRLQAQSERPSFPVWMMTGSHHVRAEVRAREVGGRALLKKPFDTDAFLREMETYWAASPPAP